MDSSRVLREVVALTRSCATDDFVALYAYGGSTRREVDEWSDLDVCSVWKPSEDWLLHLREWAARLQLEFAPKVDAVGLCTDNLGANAPWSLSFVLVALLQHSRLLLGEDVRHLVCMPTEHKLRLNVTFVALCCVRRLYLIPREECVPAALCPPDISEDVELPWGNVAWQVSNTVMQLLRAIIFLESGVFCESKSHIRQELRRWEEEELVRLCAGAIGVRKEVPRFAQLESVPTSVLCLSTSIPRLTSRLLNDMARLGLEDPSYHPGAPVYSPDGTRNCPTGQEATLS